jgi:HEAT repeat protein
VPSLLSPDEDQFESALVDAVNAGPPGERRLIDAFTASPGGPDDEQRGRILGAIGEADGPGGVAVLRAAIVGEDDPYLREVAVQALAKREGVAATGRMVAALTDMDENVREAAVRSLAAAGDDRGWQAVSELLRSYLEGLSDDPLGDLGAVTLQSSVLPALCYLGRHAAAEPGRAETAAGLVRASWRRLYPAEQRWLTENWPACDPAHPLAATVPDPTWLADWASHPFFDAFYLR